MLSEEDKYIASKTLQSMVNMRRSGTISQIEFDRKMKLYLQGLFEKKGMEVEEMKELTRSAGLDLEIRIHTNKNE